MRQDWATCGQQTQFAVCPECSALVPCYEDNMEKHARWHQVQTKLVSALRELTEVIESVPR